MSEFHIERFQELAFHDNTAVFHDLVSQNHGVITFLKDAWYLKMHGI